jgi:hypothetical protein
LTKQSAMTQFTDEVFFFVVCHLDRSEETGFLIPSKDLDSSLSS